MRTVWNYLVARPITSALVAGLVAFGAVVVLGSGVVGIPDVLLLHFADGRGGAEVPLTAKAPEGGESVSAKLPPSAQSSKQAPSKIVAAPVAPVVGEPRLDGLADIPLDLWPRQESRPDETKSLETKTGEKELLPWDEVEPVPLSLDSPPAAAAKATAALPSTAMPEASDASVTPMQLPAVTSIEGWVKAKATEINGAEGGRPLHHFEYWLDAPEDVKQRLIAVAYEFNTPAVMPQSQVSKDKKTGFRISVGGLTCADKVTVTLQFYDGRSQRVAVDGCRLLN
jgi:hypothetical protein